jgi:hypothetical protein
VIQAIWGRSSTVSSTILRSSGLDLVAPAQRLIIIAAAG